MIEAGKTYAYFYEAGKRGDDVTITNIINNDTVAMAISGEFGGMGPFALHFDINTGKGLNDYAGTHLEEIS